MSEYSIFTIAHLRTALNKANEAFDQYAAAGALSAARGSHAEARRIEQELVSRGHGGFVDGAYLDDIKFRIHMLAFENQSLACQLQAGDSE